MGGGGTRRSDPWPGREIGASPGTDILRCDSDGGGAGAPGAPGTEIRRCDSEGGGAAAGTDILRCDSDGGGAGGVAPPAAAGIETRRPVESSPIDGGGAIGLVEPGFGMEMRRQESDGGGAAGPDDGVGIDIRRAESDGSWLAASTVGAAGAGDVGARGRVVGGACAPAAGCAASR